MNNKIEMLKTASEYIEKLKKTILTIAQYLRGSQYEVGLNLIPSIADGLNWLSIIIENTKDIQKEEISLNELNDKLNEMLEALERGDNILLGDLFEYELFPIIEKIGNIINNSI